MSKDNVQLWQDEAKKLGGQALVDKLIGMADSLESIAHMELRLNVAEKDIKDLYEAFPAADTDGHRCAHEAMIEDVNSRRRLTQAIQEKTISGLIWSGIVFAGGLVWVGFLEFIKK